MIHKCKILTYDEQAENLGLPEKGWATCKFDLEDVGYWYESDMGTIVNLLGDNVPIDTNFKKFSIIMEEFKGKQKEIILEIEK